MQNRKFGPPVIAILLTLTLITFQHCSVDSSESGGLNLSSGGPNPNPTPFRPTVRLGNSTKAMTAPVAAFDVSGDCDVGSYTTYRFEVAYQQNGSPNTAVLGVRVPCTDSRFTLSVNAPALRVTQNFNGVLNIRIVASRTSGDIEGLPSSMTLTWAGCSPTATCQAANAFCGAPVPATNGCTACPQGTNCGCTPTATCPAVNTFCGNPTPATNGCTACAQGTNCGGCTPTATCPNTNTFCGNPTPATNGCTACAQGTNCPTTGTTTGCTPTATCRAANSFCGNPDNPATDGCNACPQGTNCGCTPTATCRAADSFCGAPNPTTDGCTACPQGSGCVTCRVSFTNVARAAQQQTVFSFSECEGFKQTVGHNYCEAYTCAEQNPTGLIYSIDGPNAQSGSHDPFYCQQSPTDGPCGAREICDIWTSFGGTTASVPSGSISDCQNAFNMHWGQICSSNRNGGFSYSLTLPSRGNVGTGYEYCVNGSPSGDPGNNCGDFNAADFACNQEYFDAFNNSCGVGTQNSGCPDPANYNCGQALYDQCGNSCPAGTRKTDYCQEDSDCAYSCVDDGSDCGQQASMTCVTPANACASKYCGGGYACWCPPQEPLF